MNYSQQSDLFRYAGITAAGQANRAGLVEAMFHLTHLLRAGCSISAALDDVIDMESGYIMRRVWTDVRLQVGNGLSLSESMALWPRYFPASSCGLIRSGEASGELAAACQSCLEDLQWQEDLRNRMMSALVYPVLALIIVLSVLIFLFVSVVPSMQGFLRVSPLDLSWHTQLLLSVSVWLQSNVHALLAGGVGIAVVFFLARLLLPFGLTLTDQALLRTPLIGPILTELSLSQYASTTAHLYRSGLKLPDAMEIGEELVRNKVLRIELRQIRTRMVAGSTLGISLQFSSKLPRCFKRMIAMGEAAGALENALTHVSLQQRKLAEFKIQRLESLIGPAVLMMVGSCLVWIVISLIGPVYSSVINSVLSS